MKKVILISLLLVFPFICFAQSGSSTPPPNIKIEELQQFLTKYQEDIQNAEKREEELLKSESYSDDNTAQMVISFLDNQEMPAMMHAYHFLLLGASPEMWEDMTIAEEYAQVYLKMLKHPNPIIRLHGLIVLEDSEEGIKKPADWLTKEDIETTRKFIKIVKAEHSPSVQDQKLLKQYKQCFAYLAPLFTQAQDKTIIGTSDLIAVFRDVEPAVKFNLVFKLSFVAMASEHKEIEELLAKLGSKGDVYVKGLVASAIMDKVQMNKLLKNSTNPDEFITLAEFLNSRNVWLTPDAWPDKTKLDAFIKEASPWTRGQLLKLMKKAVETD